MISFVRVDDRMIHGQTVTRWALEVPCDGIIAVMMRLHQILSLSLLTSQQHLTRKYLFGHLITSKRALRRF